VKPPRLSFCSDKCVDEWRIRSSPSYVRHKLYNRDHAICAECGVDCRALVGELEALDDYYQYHKFKCGWGYGYADNIRQNIRLMERLKELCIPVHRYIHRRHEGIWDADHIKPVIEGGGECSLQNMRTLCLACHRHETTKLAARRARRSA